MDQRIMRAGTMTTAALLGALAACGGVTVPVDDEAGGDGAQAGRSSGGGGGREDVGQSTGGATGGGHADGGTPAAPGGEGSGPPEPGTAPPGSWPDPTWDTGTLGLPPPATGKVDVLLVVDNSSGMQHVQARLRRTAPQLIRALTEGVCVAAGQAPSPPSDGSCPAGAELRPPLADDLHVGIITTSMGSHAGDLCQVNPGDDDRNRDDDRGWLVPTLPGAQSPLPPHDGEHMAPPYGGPELVSWRASDADAAAQRDALTTELDRQLEVVGNTGCGFEAPLEALYRFAIDPEPPAQILVPEGASTSGPALDPDGNIVVDTTLLSQRARFFRSDSRVLFVVVSDEDDCSIVDHGFGWLISRGSRMFRGSAECATAPESPCCRSCATPTGDTAEGACAPFDPAASGCTPNRYETDSDDPLNLRCFDHKGRFGMDLLWPLGRYVEGLTQPWVHQRGGDGELRVRPNPLLSGGVRQDARWVELVVVGGLPPVDLATTAGDGGPTGAVRRADEFEAPLTSALLTDAALGATRWEVLLGSASAPALDPRMRPRRQSLAGAAHPFLGVADIALGLDEWEPVSGFDRDYARSDELNPACISPLAEQPVCEFGTNVCACSPQDVGSAEPYAPSPLCRAPDGTQTTTQTALRALPTPRLLSVARALGERGWVASVCEGAGAEAPYAHVFDELAARAGQ